MNYKNIIAYKGNKISKEALTEALAKKPFKSCAPHQAVSIGFVDVIEGELTTEVKNCLLMKLRIDKKPIPKDVLKDNVNEIVLKALEENEHICSPAEIDKIVDEETAKLLEVAFVKKSYINAYINNESEFVFVESGSAASAEILLETLKGLLVTEELSTSVLSVKKDVVEKMTKWLKDKKEPEEGGLIIGECCSIKGDNKSKIVVTGMDLFSPQVTSHVAGGKEVDSMEFYIEDVGIMTLNKNLEIKKVRPLFDLKKTIEEALGDSSSEDDYMLAEINLLIDMHAKFIEDIGEAFGGYY